MLSENHVLPERAIDCWNWRWYPSSSILQAVSFKSKTARTAQCTIQINVITRIDNLLNGNFQQSSALMAMQYKSWLGITHVCHMFACLRENSTHSGNFHSYSYINRFDDISESTKSTKWTCYWLLHPLFNVISLSLWSAFTWTSVKISNHAIFTAKLLICKIDTDYNRSSCGSVVTQLVSLLSNSWA